MVTENGRSLKSVEDSGFRRILNPILEGLSKKGEKIVINRHNIRRLVFEEASKIKKKITDEVQGRLICVKVDCATRLDRSIMGVNIQYVKNQKLIVRNICTKELYCSHTSINLQAEIYNELKQFGIEPRMVYSMTTDNAANMLKTIKLMSEVVNSLEICGEALGDNTSAFNTDTDSDSDSNSNSENSSHTNSNDSYNNAAERDNENQNDINQDEDHKIYLSEVFEKLPKEFTKDGVFGQSCVPHSLQLAIENALTKAGVDKILDAARALIKKLRTPTFSLVLRTLGKTKPVIDNTTRWHSKYDMCNSLLPFKEMPLEILSLLKKTKTQNLTTKQWTELEIFVETLAPATIATKHLQSEQLQVGHFLEIWLTCKYKIKRINGNLAEELVAAMGVREEKLFDSPAILCAIFMDPRWKVMLSEQYQQAAVRHLINVWQRLQLLKPNTEMTSSCSSLSTDYNPTEYNNMQKEEKINPIEEMLREKDKKRSFQKDVIRDKKEDEIKQLLLNFMNEARIHTKEDIFMYWEKRKINDPDLYEIAQTVLALPVTQVTVERLFSHLKFILNDLRSKMSATVVNAILFVRCNRIFNKEIKTKHKKSQT